MSCNKGRIIVKSLDHLKNLVSEKAGEFSLRLKYGLNSTKIIQYDSCRDMFDVFHSIDDSESLLSSKEIMDEDYSNIGQAIKIGCLIFDEYV